jgi:hypothetical protein
MKLLIVLSAFIFSCSSGPVPSKTPTAPEWTRQPVRTQNDSTISYVGTGEDRTPENALFKSDAIALQDLENECSLIPKNTTVQTEHYQEQVGIIYRSFSLVSVSMSDCDNAKKPLTVAQLHEQANPQLSAVVASYQKSYDAPEKEENYPITETQLSSPISDASRLFIARQQVALAQQSLILSNPSASSPESIAKEKESVSEFEKNHPVSQPFSTGRPNWINHQASAVRETIQTRAQIKDEYGYTPTPIGNSGKKSKPAARGRGSRRGNQQPPPSQQSPDSAPSPIPSL